MTRTSWSVHQSRRRYLFFNNAGGPTDKDFFMVFFWTKRRFSLKDHHAINMMMLMGCLLWIHQYILLCVNCDTTLPRHATPYIKEPGAILRYPVFIGDGSGCKSGFYQFRYWINAAAIRSILPRGFFRRCGFPVSSDIVIAIDNAAALSADPGSAAIMPMSIQRLEYAPPYRLTVWSFFSPGLTYPLRGADYRATRDTTDSAFNVPVLVGAIEGLSKDRPFHRTKSRFTITGSIQIQGILKSTEWPGRNIHLFSKWITNLSSFSGTLLALLAVPIPSAPFLSLIFFLRSITDFFHIADWRSPRQPFEEPANPKGWSMIFPNAGRKDWSGTPIGLPGHRGQNHESCLPISY